MLQVFVSYCPGQKNSKFQVPTPPLDAVNEHTTERRQQQRAPAFGETRGDDTREEILWTYRDRLETQDDERRKSQQRILTELGNPLFTDEVVRIEDLDNADRTLFFSLSFLQHDLPHGRGRVADRRWSGSAVAQKRGSERSTLSEDSKCDGGAGAHAGPRVRCDDRLVPAPIPPSSS